MVQRHHKYSLYHTDLHSFLFLFFFSLLIFSFSFFLLVAIFGTALLTSSSQFLRSTGFSCSPCSYHAGFASFPHGWGWGGWVVLCFHHGTDMLRMGKGVAGATGGVNMYICVH